MYLKGDWYGFTTRDIHISNSQCMLFGCQVQIWGYRVNITSDQEKLLTVGVGVKELPYHILKYLSLDLLYLAILPYPVAAA